MARVSAGNRCWRARSSFPTTESDVTLSATYTLLLGSIHAVRAAFLERPIEPTPTSPCINDLTYQDQDDVVFAVKAGH
jgi:hypothetical protein